MLVLKSTQILLIQLFSCPYRLLLHGLVKLHFDRLVGNYFLTSPALNYVTFNVIENIYFVQKNCNFLTCKIL